jgi:RNA-binding protein YlmH
MNDDTELLKKRLKELYDKADNGAYYTFTDFLGLMEQSVLAEIMPRLYRGSVDTYGGAEGAERVMIRFGSESDLGYSMPYPISLLKVEPLSQKYAEKLSHRDFLGAIMNLGIERDTMGDIVIIDNVGYIFVKEDMATYIADSLTKVRRTDVKAEVTETLPDGELYRTERRNVQANGERLDALVAKVFSLPREEAQSLFKKRLVFADGRQIDSTSYVPKQNEKISVRGHGRFIYLGPQSLTRKGKMNISVEIYI